ncbi:hypothetical protein [Terrabacter sp. Ter38]|uniref:hypothetical protein n=1 Tax=Terrabacter sp. Ter38 TaxID=2926030 RepID=UPI002117F5BB|nr:hypothetical protein [Terrabacter sp. Ter38]
MEVKRVETHIPMWIHWLEICQRHVKAATNAREKSLASRRSGDRKALSDSMHDEFQSSVQALSAAAFAMEAFRNALDDLGIVDADTKARWRSQRASAATKVIDTALAAGDVSRADLAPESVATIFKYRNSAVHPKVEFREPQLHPVLKMAVDQSLIIYGLENGRNALSVAASVVAFTVLDAHAVDDESARSFAAWRTMLRDFATEHDLTPNPESRLHALFATDGDHASPSPKTAAD